VQWQISNVNSLANANTPTINNMNKEQAKERLCAIETEVEKLRRIIDEPEARKPEAGDVWTAAGTSWLVTNDGHWVVTEALRSDNMGRNTGDFDPNDSSEFKNLGKFDEVYVKISDVRDALSVVDKEGDDAIGLLRSFNCNQWGAYSTLEALRKLNIITD